MSDRATAIRQAALDNFEKLQTKEAFEAFRKTITTPTGDLMTNNRPLDDLIRRFSADRLNEEDSPTPERNYDLDACLIDLAAAATIAARGRDALKAALQCYDKATDQLQPGTDAREGLLAAIKQSEVAVTGLSRALSLAVAAQS